VSSSGPQRVLCESPCGEQRLEFASSFLRQLPRESGALIVGSSQAAAQWLVARSLPPGEARFAWHRRTLANLAQELALPALASQRIVALGGLGALALCTRVSERLARAGRLGRYTAIAAQPGFARALSRTLGELRLAQVGAAQLATHDADLARLLEAYEADLEELALADSARVLALAAGQVARTPAQRFAGLPRVFLDLELAHAAQRELVRALCAGAEPVCVTVARGDSRSECHFRDALPDRLHVARLEPQADAQLARLKRRLFTPGAPGAAAAAVRGEVEIVSSPGESREAVEVARAILQAAHEQVPFDRMAIALRSVDSYRAVVEEALSRAAIPAHFAEGVQRPRPEGRALLALLECAREELSVRGFAEYLSLGVLPLPEAELARAAPRRWERLLREADIHAGRARWRAQLARHGQVLAQRVRDLREQELDAGASERDAEALRALEAFCEPLLDRLERLRTPQSWGGLLRELEALARAALREPDAVCEALAELAPLAEIGPVDLHQVHAVLAPRLSSVLLRSTGHGAGKVFVGTPEELLGRSFDLVFVPGLAEQLFPPRLSEDPLLPDRVRAELSPELPLLMERAARERLLLRVCVGAARRRLVLSYPRFDLEHGRPRVPSFYGLEVLHALDGVLPAFDELARRARPGAAARMGFPAPEQPELAIDDGEYDLAVLGELLRAPAAERVGALRYLLTQHPHLARALRFRARRWSLARFTACDGFVAQDAAELALLAGHQLAARAYSASSLALVSACPYRFFLRSVAGVPEPDPSEPLDELDARLRGVLMHRVQRALLATLRAREQLPLREPELPAALALLRQLLDQLANEERARRPRSQTSVFDEGLASLAHDLEEWLRLCARAPEWVPQHFELAFGLSRKEAETDPKSSPEPAQLGPLRLLGVMDLVERHVQPGPDGRPLLRVTDYKSSLPEEGRGDTYGGKVLQPLLYALALERLFPNASVLSGRLYFCTSRADFADREVPLDPGRRALFADLIGAIQQLLETGFLPAAPRKDACQTCSYRVVCGPYEEERVAGIKVKDMARLAPLFRLRNLP
jgi:ATP-dependent helicase/nuclease subunit B